MTLLTIIGGTAVAITFFAWCVVRDGARRNACQDRIVRDWLRRRP